MSVFVFSDLHGEYSLWEQIRDFMGENDRAYCLGDCIDRGPDGLRIMEEVLADPRITYIRGNHEDMMMKAIQRPDSFTDAMNLWMYNGGYPTFEAWEANREQIWVSRIKEMPLYARYVNTLGNVIWLCHGGFYSEYTPETITDDNDLIWDRRHIYEVHWQGQSNEFIVHGHTPTQYLVSEMNERDAFFDDNPEEEWEWTPEAIYYCDDHKIDIDMGTYISHQAILMDLDTADEYLFSSKPNEE